jgi:hypothetical protein
MPTLFHPVLHAPSLQSSPSPSLPPFPFLHQEKEDRVFIHPSSINYTQGAYTVPWLVHSDIVRTTKPYVRDCTEVRLPSSPPSLPPSLLSSLLPSLSMDHSTPFSASPRPQVSPYALLLAASSLRLQHEATPSFAPSSAPSSSSTGTLLLEKEGWMRFAAVGRIGALISALKKKVDELLEVGKEGGREGGREG